MLKNPVNPRRIKTRKLGSDISSVPSAAATVLCPHITKDVKFLERDQRILLKKRNSAAGKQTLRWEVSSPSAVEKKRFGMDCCSVWRNLHLKKISEHAGQKEMLLTLQANAKQVPVVRY